MPRFTVTRTGPRAEIAFDDGGVNVLSSAALRELRGAIDALRGAEGTGPAGAEKGPPLEAERPRLLVFRSSHSRIFAAGADMAEMQAFSPLDAGEFARLGQETFRAIDTLPMITVAVIDGDCFGGALDLVLSFDLRVATPRSRFSHPGGKLGIVTGFGGTSRWRTVLGSSAARALFLGNPVMTAAEAAAVGLVDKVADDFEPALTHLQSLDGATVRFVKELTIHGERLGRADRLLVAERLGHIYFGEG